MTSAHIVTLVKPAVHAVLLNWNDSAETVRCVESLLRSAYPNLSVVVVDNASRPDDLRLLSRGLSPTCHLILNETNSGFSEGNNIGVRFAVDQGADFVLVLNNDVVVHSDAVARLVNAAVADDDVGIVSPVIMLASGFNKVVFPRRVHSWPPLLYFLAGTIAGMEVVPTKDRSDRSRLGTVDGCCFLIRRSVIPNDGLFDPAFFFGGYESTDLCMRILDGGSRIMGVSDAFVWAERGDRRVSAIAYSYWSPRSRVIFARKNLGPVHFSVFLFLLPLHVLSWIISWGVGSRDPRVIFQIARGLWEGLRDDVRRKAR